MAEFTPGPWENERLMESAPDLYEALNEAIDWLEYSTPEENQALQLQRTVILKCKLALAKADGK